MYPKLLNINANIAYMYIFGNQLHDSLWENMASIIGGLG
jgi:hypothetical protein